MWYHLYFLPFGLIELSLLIIIVLDRSVIPLLVGSFNFRPDILDSELFPRRLIFNIRLLLFLLVNCALFFATGITVDVADFLSDKLFFNENNDGDVFV